MTIRQCTTQDIQMLADFYDQVVLHLTQTTNWPKWRYKQYPNIDSVTEDITQGAQYVCLDDDGVALGAFVINQDARGAYEKGDWSVKLSDKDYYVIHSFAVNPSFYKKGIANCMIDYCKQLCIARGAKAIHIDVVPTNAPAIALYTRNGFTFAGEKDLDRGFDDIPTFCLYEFNF